jgi:hypothetical protein
MQVPSVLGEVSQRSHVSAIDLQPRLGQPDEKELRKRKRKPDTDRDGADRRSVITKCTDDLNLPLRLFPPLVNGSEH